VSREQFFLLLTAQLLAAYYSIAAANFLVEPMLCGEYRNQKEIKFWLQLR